MLEYLRDPARWFEEHGIPIPDLKVNTLNNLIDEAHVPLADDDNETLHVVLIELQQRYLAYTGERNDEVSPEELWKARLTFLGSQLLDFVIYIEPPADDAPERT